ncbi:MAG: hypothetical protein J2P49_02325 [Methylocapsa sp.]|nr:hypothetical protein [Methylocapsa sp.]
MGNCPGSAAWVNSKTVVEFLLEENAQDAYPRELAWMRDKLPKSIEVRRQMFRSREDQSIDMTLAGFTYLLACRRWPEGGYSPDEYDAIAMSAGEVFPAMLERERVRLTGARRADERRDEGRQQLVPAGVISWPRH